MITNVLFMYKYCSLQNGDSHFAAVVVAIVIVSMFCMLFSFVWFQLSSGANNILYLHVYRVSRGLRPDSGRFRSGFPSWWT